MAYESLSNMASGAGKMTDRDFEQLRDFIYHLCGIYFGLNKKYFLESRIRRRMDANACDSHAEYHALLKNSRGASDELKRLLEEITTNETCFFRNMPQLTALENKFFPDLVAEKTKLGFKKLRIWSAGSSSGEEAYTMAMVINERRPAFFKEWTIEIIGTDINEAVLAQAREGVYSAYSVRNTPDYYRKKYFSEESRDRYILSPELRKMVTFTPLNLYDDTKMLFMKSFDLIFCANVLIYFDLASKSKIVQHFFNNLQPYGYFFVGQSESLHGVNERFKTIHFPGGFAYRK
jgi:chemotaxis protein methyltransferase CheR